MKDVGHLIVKIVKAQGSDLYGKTVNSMLMIDIFQGYILLIWEVKVIHLL